MTEAGAFEPTLETAALLYQRLTEQSNLLLREEELLRLFAETVRQVVPGSMVAVRLVGDGSTLSHVYATGRLRPETRDRLRISRDDGAAGVSEAVRTAHGLERVERYEPVFAHGAGGAEVVLHKNGVLYGMLNLEWEQPLELSPTTRLLLDGVGQHLAGMIHGARLMTEAFRVRDELGQLLDHAEAPIVVVDRNRRAVLINRCLERLSGHERTAVVGRETAELVHPDDRARFASALAAALRGRTVSGVEVRLAGESRTPALVSFNVAPVKGRAGEDVQEAVAVGQVLTEIRRLQAQMIHTEKLATIGQLAAGVVHEINNPLTSVAIHADYLVKLLERQGQMPQALAYVRRIREAVDRILKFTQDLTTFARPSGDEPEQVDLKAVIDQSTAFCEHVIAKAGVTVERKMDSVARIYGVRSQLQQVFINLITNACHAMRDQDRERRLTLALADHGDGRVRVEVRDTGAGVADEVRERIFEPFVTTKREGEGTGLGLSIVRNILDNHQAEIRFETEVGKGTAFSLLFYAV